MIKQIFGNNLEKQKTLGRMGVQNLEFFVGVISQMNSNHFTIVIIIYSICLCQANLNLGVVIYYGMC